MVFTSAATAQKVTYLQGDATSVEELLKRLQLKEIGPFKEFELTTALWTEQVARLD